MQSVAMLKHVYYHGNLTLKVCNGADACTDIHPLRNVGHDHIIAQVIACVTCALSQPHNAQGKMLTFNLACDPSDSSKQQSNVGHNKRSLK